MRTLVILTGGTFGSSISDNRLSAKLAFSQHHELSNIVASYFSEEVTLSFCQPFSKLSENIVPDDWEQIFSVLLEQKNNYDNALIVHGTDTMAYSAAALAYLNALKLDTTIVVTGANLPLSSENSDAQTNFIQSIGALKYLQDNGITGSFIVFNGTNEQDRHGRMHVGVRVKKDKWDDYCYRSFYMGKQSIGEVLGTNVSTFDNAQYANLLSGQRKINLKTCAFSSKGVAAVKIYPGLHPASLPSPQNGLKYVLLELYNSGTAPADDSEYSLVPWVKQVVSEGVLVFAISQHEGKQGVSMDIYETSAALLDAGVIPLGDLIWEAALPKLMLAASNYNNINDIVDFMRANIAGEILSA